MKNYKGASPRLLLLIGLILLLALFALAPLMF